MMSPIVCIKPSKYFSRFLRRISSHVLSEAKSETKNEITEENQYDKLAEVITPLAYLDYNEQISLKLNWSRNMPRQIYLRNKHIPRFKTKVFKVIPSPIKDGYRNKDEFSIRTGVDGDPKTVGFFVGSPSEGEVTCVPPHKLVNIKRRHIELSQLFQEFIRNSDLKACHDLHDGGFWRNIIIRSNQHDDVMATVIVHPRGASEDELNFNIYQLANVLKNQNIKSFYYQACSNVRCTNENAPFVHLFGDKHIYEEIGGYKFQISPDSFFQINPGAAENLYSRAIKLSEATEKSTLLDLCCGTGTLSVLASSFVRGCVGIEVVKQAIKDARANATINDVTNCYFIDGTIEKKLAQTLRDHSYSPDIVAVLNPGRAGVARSAIKSLRNCLQIHNLVYISCKADNSTTMKNFVDLCNPKFDDSPPFTLYIIQPVDMFPHTSHCELIMVFKR